MSTLAKSFKIDDKTYVICKDGVEYTIDGKTFPNLKSAEKYLEEKYASILNTKFNDSFSLSDSV